MARRIPLFLPNSLVDYTSAWSGRQQGGGAERLGRRAGEMTSNSRAKPEKSYLSAAVESISPWSTSRSSTPKPSNSTGTGGPELISQKGTDYSLSHHHGISLRRYPKDCPPLNAHWFYAVDVSYGLLYALGLDKPLLTSPCRSLNESQRLSKILLESRSHFRLKSSCLSLFMIQGR